MKNPFLIGKRIYLRPLEMSDLERCLRWINDPEVTRTLAMHRPWSELREREWLERLYRDERDIPLAIVLKEDDRHIGNVGLHQLNWKDRHAMLGIMIGEKDEWGKGYGTEAVELMLRYGFERLNLHRIYLYVHEHNPRAIRCYEKAGFRHEGTLREAYFLEGRYYDTLVMGILRQEWEALRSAGDRPPPAEGETENETEGERRGKLV